MLTASMVLYDEISIMSSDYFRKENTSRGSLSRCRKNGKKDWNTDITYEPVPSDYTIPRLVEVSGTSEGRILALQHRLRSMADISH